MEILKFLENGIWFGFAALGFAVLFNVPQRTLLIIWVLAAIGGLTKLLLIHFGISVILSSFIGSSLIGTLSIPAAHNKHSPPLVFAVPSVIPMIPGVFAYQMILGVLELAGNPLSKNYSLVLSQTVSNGLKVLFILMSLAVGVSIPMLITRKSTIKRIKVDKSK